MTRYVIVGAGAVGVALAVELGERGHDIRLVARGSALEHLAREPLSYHTHRGSRAVRLPVAGPADDLGLGPDDILVLAVKTQDVDAALPALAWREVRGPDGEVLGVAAGLLPVVTVQNGLDAERSAARWFDTVVGAVMMISARYATIGEVRVGGHPHVGSVIAGHAAGDRAATGRAAKTLIDDARDAGFRAAEVDDIGPYKAAKLLHSVRNGVEVLAGDRAVKDAVGSALTAEARDVLTAAGIAYRDTDDLILDPAQQHTSARAGVVGRRPSTWQSFARGGATHEVDYLNGEIALLARASGRSAPLNTRLQHLLGQAAARGGGVDLPGLDQLAAALPEELTVDAGVRARSTAPAWRSGR
ncbi:ketopantoate reductase family protein [Nocardia sp. N2S4-5]|uniref:ketopantoate reductase family protein n=1 Tax=Nocardia sp. N2S4-5 TaxID=3351565 RepID=UPI0037D8662F